jgi:hypothetical protein
MLQALRSLQGVGHYLPTSLPPLLETLKWIAEPNVRSGWGMQAAEQMEAAAEGVCRLENLKRLTVRRYRVRPLPLTFVSQLPSSVQVGQQRPMWVVHSSRGHQLCMQLCLHPCPPP